MRIEIFEPDLSNRHEITHAISVQFSVKYNDVGKFTIVLPMDAYNISIAKNDAIVYLVERNLAFEVAEVQFDDENNQITLNGYTLNNRLNRRVAATACKVTNIEKDIYAAVKANLRGLPILTAAEKGLTETTSTTTVYGEELLSAVQEILSDADLGQRAVFDYKAKTIAWEIYKGVDRTTGLKAVSFVAERGTAAQLVIDQDVSSYKNVCYCTAQYADGSKCIATAGQETGGNRRELWAEFSGDPQGKTETKDDFARRVQTYAALQLGSHRNRQSFNLSADASELGVAYDIGDLVWCVSQRHNVKFKARITGMTYAQDQRSTSIGLTIGDPILTVMG